MLDYLTPDEDPQRRENVLITNRKSGCCHGLDGNIRSDWKLEEKDDSHNNPNTDHSPEDYQKLLSNGWKAFI